MINFSLVTLFPDLYEPFLKTSLVDRAISNKKVTFSLKNLFGMVAPGERIDAPTFGHGPGMLVRPDVVERAVQEQEAISGPAFKIFFSPHGKKLDQQLLQELAKRLLHEKREHIMLLPARYEGMDARVEEHYADLVISVGDFVTMGGDIPAMLFLEAFLRLLPGIVGKQESVEHDSFSGAFVDYPAYTAPLTWQGMTVPEVLRSGNHAAMAAWRMEQAVERTVSGHFDWLRAHVKSEADKKCALEHIPAHYSVLMHTDVLIGKDKQEGTTSVTSIDIHDIARSSKTYGIKQFFIVTPLADQQKVVGKMLDFWKEGGVGQQYNESRYSAVQTVTLVGSLDEAMETINAQEKARPLLIATSAQQTEHPGAIFFGDQQTVWAHKRPVVFVFGTGQGLTQAAIQRCDYLLPPVCGFTSFNHLSVRSAVAIVYDRWLGINITSHLA